MIHIIRYNKPSLRKALSINYIILPLVLMVFGCSKTEYREITDPAYLRVFNSLNYEARPENRFQLQPFITMLIDPEFDADGIPIGGKIVGDHLDQRSSYAPPYPSHSSTGTSFRNPEYPGKANVLVAPVLNGFDLSSWAQIPSGEHRILFMFRPISATPFSQLEQRLRNNVVLDTTLRLDAGEIYTLNVIQKDFVTKKNGMILRQENFHRQPFAEDRVYFNVYNLSAKGFWQAESYLKPERHIPASLMRWGIRDEMDIYLSLYKEPPYNLYEKQNSLPGHFLKFLGIVKRSTESGQVNPYFSFPLFADQQSDGISTAMMQSLVLVSNGRSPTTIPPQSDAAGDADYASFTFYGRIPDDRYNENLLAWPFPNMVVNEHSGIHNPRSFATVNSIELINGNAYLMTVQRKYPAPIHQK